MLEEVLDVRLFDRNSRNVRLTAAGAALAPTVERLTADFDAAFRELTQTFDGMRGRVVIGALPSAAAIILPDIIATFRPIRPNVEIIIREHLAEDLFQGLRDRALDFAICTPPPISAELKFEPLFDDECVLVGRAADIEAVKDRAPWSVFAEFPFIAMERRSSVRILTDQALSRAGITAPALFECAQLATLGGLIRAGLGISLVPKSTLPLVATQSAIAWREMQPPTVSRTIGVGRLRDRTLAPSAAAFLAALLKVDQFTFRIDR